MLMFLNLFFFPPIGHDSFYSNMRVPALMVVWSKALGRGIEKVANDLGLGGDFRRVRRFSPQISTA